MRKLNQNGMTLIEIMIVIAIVAGLMAVLATNVMSSWERARFNQGEIQIRNIVSALDKYQLDCNTAPTVEQGLDALITKPADEQCANWGPEPYVSKKQLKDPYGHSFVYDIEEGKPVVTFLGKNGKPGGQGYDRDLSSKEESGAKPE